jgi:hypothetical protein
VRRSWCDGACLQQGSAWNVDVNAVAPVQCVMSRDVVCFQVVTLSVYTYFIAALMGRQFVLSDTDMFFPFFTVLQVRTSSRPCGAN